MLIYAGNPDLTRERIGFARGTYYGMIRLVDDQVGKLRKVLKDQVVSMIPSSLLTGTSASNRASTVSERSGSSATPTFEFPLS